MPLNIYDKDSVDNLVDAAKTRTVVDVTSNVTLDLSMSYQILRMTGGSGITVTVPADADVNFPVGTCIIFVVSSTSLFQIQPDTLAMTPPNVNGSTSTITIGQYVSHLIKGAAGEWHYA